MKRIFLLFFVVVAVGICAGKTYTVTLYNPAVVGNTELKAGAYKITVVDQNAMIINGKADTRTPVRVETMKEKYHQTSVRVNNSDGKSRVEEIRLGGTNMKLVVSEPSTNAGN
jgi:hypothetical protein